MEWIRALLTNNSHWHLWVECLCLSCRLPRFCRITGAFHCLTRYRSGSFCQHTSSPMLCSLSACFERDTSLLHSRADTSLSLCQSSKCSAEQRLIPWCIAVLPFLLPTIVSARVFYPASIRGVSADRHNWPVFYDQNGQLECKLMVGWFLDFMFCLVVVEWFCPALRPMISLWLASWSHPVFRLIAVTICDLLISRL